MGLFGVLLMLFPWFETLAQLASYPLHFNPFVAHEDAVAPSHAYEFPGPRLFNAAFLLFISHQEEILFWCAVGVVAGLLLVVVVQIIVELRQYGLMLNRCVGTDTLQQFPPPSPAARSCFGQGRC